MVVNKGKKDVSAKILKKILILGLVSKIVLETVH